MASVEEERRHVDAAKRKLAEEEAALSRALEQEAREAENKARAEREEADRMRRS